MRRGGAGRARGARAAMRGALAVCAVGATTMAFAQSPACPGAGCAPLRDSPERPSAPASACGVGATDVPQRQFDRGCLARRRFLPGDGAHAAAADGASSSPAGEPFEKIVVWGTREDDDLARPALEQRFAAALVAGNPEAPGGKIRHGAYHAYGVYWGRDPLSFLYLNIRYGLLE